MKIFKWSVLAIIALVVAAFAFVHFSPDYAMYSVRTESMNPAIKMGDMIVTGPLNGLFSGELQPGEVVTYIRNKELITHRVVSVDGNTLLTKGDAMEESDPWTVAMSDVSGAYLFKIPYGGYLANFIRTKLGWFLVVILPSMLLVGLISWDIVKEVWAIKAGRASASTAQEIAEAPTVTVKEAVEAPAVTVKEAKEAVEAPAVAFQEATVRTPQQAIVSTTKINKSVEEIIKASTKEFKEAAESLTREFEKSLGRA